MRIENIPAERIRQIDSTALKQENRVAEKGPLDKKEEVRSNDSGQLSGHNQQSMEKELSDAIERANKSFKPMNRRFEYSVHETLNRVSVKVIDSSTDQLIREIPPEKLLDVMANMMEVAGIIVDERT